MCNKFAFESRAVGAAHFWENPNLESLQVTASPTLTELPRLPSSLKYFRLDHGDGLASLPELPSGLNFLVLYDCHGIKNLPQLPASLDHVVVFECSELTS